MVFVNAVDVKELDVVNERRANLVDYRAPVFGQEGSGDFDIFALFFIETLHFVRL